MQAPRFLRRLSTAARILREQGLTGVISTVERKRISLQKQRDLTTILAHDTLRDRFAEIYKRGYWLSVTNKETRSGDGSTRSFTEHYVKELNRFLDILHHEIGGKIVFFDAPCGDFNWIGPIALREDIKYIGGDIVPSIVAKNQREFGNAKVSFTEIDLTSSVFPAATVWHCRDCLIHLSFANIFRCLGNFLRSEIEYALLTCHYLPDKDANVDVADGNFRYIDLRKPPFGLPAPKAVLSDSSAGTKVARFTHAYTRGQLRRWSA